MPISIDSVVKCQNVCSLEHTTVSVGVENLAPFDRDHVRVPDTAVDVRDVVSARCDATIGHDAGRAPATRATVHADGTATARDRRAVGNDRNSVTASRGIVGRIDDFVASPDGAR